MGMSTIWQHPRDGRLAAAIGSELRRRRIEAGLSQAAVAAPFSRAFVCAVERGRAVPSIPALAVLLDHLGVEFHHFFASVQSDMTGVYTAPHADRQATTPRRRR